MIDKKTRNRGMALHLSPLLDFQVHENRQNSKEKRV